MAIDEIERTRMVQKLIDTLGEKPAATLMKCVYADGTDVGAAEPEMGLHSSIEAALARQMRTLLMTMASFTLITWVLLAVGALT